MGGAALFTPRQNRRGRCIRPGCGRGPSGLSGRVGGRMTVGASVGPFAVVQRRGIVALGLSAVRRARLSLFMQTWGDATEWLSPLFPLWGARGPVCQGTGSIFSLAGDREKISTLEPLTDLTFRVCSGAVRWAKLYPHGRGWCVGFGRSAAGGLSVLFWMRCGG